MDIVINSNVQSPLVRTLSATQGKSASFTHHIKDNVPPVSFTKIVLTPDGGATGTYNRNYKFKIPQYGYLRNFILKFTSSENGIGTSIMTDIYNQYFDATSGSRANGNTVGYYGSDATKGVVYDLKNLFGSRRTIGTGPSTTAPNVQVFAPSGFVPPFEGLVRNGNMEPWASMWLRINGGSNYNFTSDAKGAATKLGDARIFPYRYVPRYDALSAFGRNTFNIEVTSGGVTPATITGQSTPPTNGYYEEGVTVALNATPATTTLVFDMQAQDWALAVPFDGMEWHLIASQTADLTTFISDNNNLYFGSSQTAVSQSGIIGGALPSFTSGTGTSPNVQLRNRYLGQRLQSTYDWCSQANLSKHLGALMPVTVTLSTHNRVIQTIYPMETLARIYRMPQDMKRRYLAMLRPSITQGPSSVYQNTFAFTTAEGDLTGGPLTNGVTYLRSALTGTTYDPTGATNTYRAWDCYFPCFFSFFEDPSMNLDTRFVENLEIDVLVNTTANIFAPEDLGANVTNIGTPAAATAGANGTNLSISTINSRSTLTKYNGWHSSEFRQRVTIINSALSVTALAYYHNFHDSTSQAIRDSNFKPNVPANVLGYNSYSESPVLITAQQIAQGGTININLSCNNLTQELVFLIRRRQRNIATNPIQTKQAFEDFTTTLPIKSITLTGSGQQLYAGTGAECLLTDQWDFPLSSVATGTYNTNNTGIYGDNHCSMYAQSKPKCDGFFAYRIPFSFSADKTYNSGVIALQTINNPVLSIQLFPLVGWVINDDQLAAERPSVFNLDENMGTEIGLQTVYDNDFQIEVYANYWQLIRIDSNTGAVTKSLDL